MIPRSVRRLAWFAALAYAALLGASFLVGGFLLAHPWRRPLGLRQFLASVPDDWDRSFLAGLRDVELEIEPRLRLRATILDGGSARSAVLLHEFGADRTAHLELARELVWAGWNVALLDRRAHGGSGGETAALFADDAADLRRALDLLIETHGLPAARLVAIGYGDGATGALLAAQADPRIDAVCAVGAAGDGASFVRRRLARFLPLPAPLLEPPADLAVRGLTLFADRPLARLSARRALAGCSVPALLVARDDAEAADARRLASLFLPGNVRVEAAGSPQEVSSRILDFLGEHVD